MRLLLLPFAALLAFSGIPAGASPLPGDRSAPSCQGTLGQPIVEQEWIVPVGPAHVLLTNGVLPVPELEWMPRMWKRYGRESASRAQPFHALLRAGKTKELFTMLLQRRKNPDDTWKDTVYPEIAPQILPERPFEWRPEETASFWRACPPFFRRDWATAQPAGKLLRAMFAANVQVLTEAAAVTPGVDSRVAAMAYNTLLKFAQYWQLRLDEYVGPASLPHFEDLLSSTLRIWLTATGHSFEERHDLLSSVDGGLQKQRRRAFLVAPDMKTPLGKLAKRVRQRSGQDDFELELVPISMLALEIAGTIHRDSASVSLTKLLVLANDPACTASVLAAVRAKKWEDNEATGAYLGRFVAASGKSPVLPGASLPELSNLLVASQYQTRQMPKVTDPWVRRMFAVSLASNLNRAQTAFRVAEKFLKNAGHDLDALDRALASDARTHATVREEGGRRVVFLHVTTSGAPASYVAGVLHDESEKRGTEGVDPWVAIFPPSMRSTSGLGFDAPLRETTLRQVGTRLLDPSTGIADAEAVRDFLRLAAQSHRRRHDLALRMIEYNLAQLNKAIDAVQRFFMNGEEPAYNELLALLDEIQTYPINRATLLDLDVEDLPSVTPVATLTPGIALPVNSLLQKEFADAVSSNGARASLVEQISVDVASRLAEAQGFRVRNRSKEESYDLELLPRGGREKVLARLEVKGVYLSGKSRPEFEILETEIAVARDGAVPWYLIVVAFDAEGKSETYVFDKRDWRQADGGEKGRTLDFEKFVTATTTVPFPKP